MEDFEKGEIVFLRDPVKIPGPHYFNHTKAAGKGWIENGTDLTLQMKQE